MFYGGQRKKVSTVFLGEDEQKLMFHNIYY